MTDFTKLSRREREIMEIVYALEDATVSAILERISDPPTRPALRSLLGILESKGKLRHRKSGREFVYKATTARAQAGRSALRRVIAIFFSGSTGSAIASHLNDPRARFSDEELKELAALVEAKRNPSPNPKSP